MKIEVVFLIRLYRQYAIGLSVLYLVVADFAIKVYDGLGYTIV